LSELINGTFLEAGSTLDQYRAALARAITLDWLSLHESGARIRIIELVRRGPWWWKWSW
jgi:hypothetical protein